ncbi:MAG: phosphoglucosamine mutase [Deltaproteobacteria bacterium]|nr:phosphoglucosamine mutase [Deltaproteobacteria bacterium]
MGKFFGTDGIRGRFRIEPITEDFFFKLGHSCASYFHRTYRTDNIRVLVGQDTRRSGEVLGKAFAQGILSYPLTEVDNAGVLPTPALCYLTRAQGFNAGAMISASHNPYEDNGIKIFNHNGLKLTDEEENKIEEILRTSHCEWLPLSPCGRGLGKGSRAYIDFLKKNFLNLNLKKYKIVLDCAHGATYQVAPAIFKFLGGRLSILGNLPDGENINQNCGALHLENLKSEVLKTASDFGFAFDGDGDRIMCIDERGNIVDGADILAVWALFLKRAHKLKKDTVVSTSMCNFGVEKSLKELGISMIRTQVGDRYILEKMLKDGYNLGGEPSGHIIHSDILPTGDGLLSALSLCMIVKESGKTLSENISFLQKFPQVLKSFEVREKKDFNAIPHYNETLKSCQDQLGPWGRIVVRYSGTENLARVMVEGENKKIVEDSAAHLSSVIQKSIGVLSS